MKIQESVRNLLNKIPTSFQQAFGYDVQPLIEKAGYHLDKSTHAIVVVTVALLLTDPRVQTTSPGAEPRALIT